jgi:hypothetical protein
MLKAVIVLSVAATAVQSGNGSAADDTSWKREPIEAAERQLEKVRDAAGKLGRFEADFSMTNDDNAMAVETLRRGHAYVENAAGYLLEFRRVDISRMTSRRKAGGVEYALSSIHPETWLYTNGVCTVLDEEHRTYQTAKIGPKDGSPFVPSPYQFIPPWIDPTIDWKELKSRYRIEQSYSNRTELVIGLVPQKDISLGRPNGDDRLEARHYLLIDRQTCLPKKWKMSVRSRDRVITYTRLDVNPAKRELKVDLTGYQDANKVAETPAPPVKEVKKDPATTDLLALGFRILLWRLF